MSTFIESLWNSIFIPGPTPPLLLATNVTFGSLQLILLALLLATYSIHFIVLSTLCAGLWWAINWFAAELRIAQLEEEQKQITRGTSGQSASNTRMDETETGDDTEYEAEAEAEGEAHAVKDKAEETEMDIATTSSSRKVGAGFASGGGAIWNKSTAARLAPQGAEETLRKRRSMDDAADLSTDSEWERVEQEK